MLSKDGIRNPDGSAEVEEERSLEVGSAGDVVPVVGVDFIDSVG